MIKPITLFLLAVVFLNQSYAQEDTTRLINRKSAGILMEYGQPYYYLPEGTRYYVALAGGSFGFPLFKAKKNFNMSVDIYPHFGKVWVKGDTDYIEFGINVRLGFNFSISDDDVLSFKIASGPHYVTVETEKQTKGFIFSDYYMLTYRRGFDILKKKYAIDLEFGYRHISNAGIKLPNRSISNFIFGLGLYRSF